MQFFIHCNFFCQEYKFTFTYLAISVNRYLFHTFFSYKADSKAKAVDSFTVMTLPEILCIPTIFNNFWNIEENRSRESLLRGYFRLKLSPTSGRCP